MKAVDWLRRLWTNVERTRAAVQGRRTPRRCEARIAVERLEDRTLMAADFSVVLEAEEAVLNGPKAASDHAGFTGGGFADFQASSGESVRWSVVAPEEGNYDLSFRYALASGDRPLRILVNGEAVAASLSMPATGSWDLWDSVGAVAKLRAGENTIEAFSMGKSGANVDSVTVSGTDEIAAVLYEAESATLAGAVAAADHAGYTGAGFVDFLHANGDSIEWTVQADRTGDHELTFRYALDDSSLPFSHEDRPLSVEVNGTVVDAAHSFPRTASGGGWTTWAEVRLTTSLHNGENTIRVQATGESGANLDHLRVRAIDQGPGGNPSSAYNQPPQLAVIENVPNTNTLFVVAATPDQAGATDVQFTATATDDGPLSHLRYRLEDAPAGATIDATTGAFQWTLPVDADGFPTVATYSFKVVVTDQDGYGLSDDQYVYVNVSRPSDSGTDSAPIARDDVYNLVEGLSSWSVEAALGIFANDSTSSPQYVEVYNAPPGMVVDQTNGSLSYIPPTEVIADPLEFAYRIGKQANDGVQVIWSNVSKVVLHLMRVESVKFVENGTKGTLKSTTEAAVAATDSLAIFPDAPDLASRNEGRNIVRVRIELATNQAGTPVYVRAVDVDALWGEIEKFDQYVLDPWDWEGRPVQPGGDNYGRLNADATAPAEPFDPFPATGNRTGGYQGRLRTVGADSFAAENATIQVQSKLDPKTGKAYAEVELATTFAPGDNFRVIASTNEKAVKDVRMAGPGGQGGDDADWQVPPTGEVAGFSGKASQLLTIWRRLHIEQDVMDRTEGDKATTKVSAAPGEPADGKLEVRTKLDGLTANEYKSGIFRVGDKNFNIVGNTADGAFTVAVRSDGVVPTLNADATVFQDDWGADGDKIPQTIADTSKVDGVYSALQESFDNGKNRYADAFIMPQLSTLNQFDSRIPARTHAPDDALAIAGWLTQYQGSKNLETDYFWAVYVTTAFEPSAGEDADPRTGGGGILGVAVPGGLSLIYLGEFADPDYEFAAHVLPTTTAHEIGHQLGLAGGSSGVEGFHRENPPNLMSAESTSIETDTYFVATDVFYLVTRIKSPQ